jgi:hypothetical protein|tara:strand:- start:1366 stop:1839 length:474 start_codon:yes stop_codon:yes gene_type:complete
MVFIHTHGIKTDGNDYDVKVGSRYGAKEIEQQSNIVYIRLPLNVVNLSHVYTESYSEKRTFPHHNETLFLITSHILIKSIIRLLMICLKIIIDNMGPKGIGPQSLGVGQSKSPSKSDCGCGMPKPCNCGGSPNKIIGAIAGMVAPALIGKAVDKASK